MFPLKDDNPVEKTPYITITIIIICTLVFLYQFSLSINENNIFVYNFGLKSKSLFLNTLISSDTINPVITIFTSMFLHGSFFHLLGNMLFLWIYGNNIEESMGHTKFLLFYLLCGLSAALLQSFITPNSDIPMIGASGAVSGVLSAYFLLFPRARVSTLIVLFIFITIIKIPAGILIGFWFLSQLMNAYFSNPNIPGVAWYAHIGGFIMGAILIPFLKRKKFKFFSSGSYSNKKNTSIRIRFRK